MPDIVVVQSQTSQLDYPVFTQIAEMAPGSAMILYWNDYGIVRQRIDPELGIVPALIRDTTPPFAHRWIDSRKSDWRGVVGQIVDLSPTVAILSDQPQLDRLRMSQALRRAGIATVLRTDKNHLSESPRRGLARTIERAVARHGYDFMAPASRLTSDYYALAPDHLFVPFPYASDERKFSPVDNSLRSGARERLRAQMGIASDAPVFLSATKFSSRESPFEVAEAFARTLAAVPDAFLIALGDGPQLDDVKAFFAERNIRRVAFPGFVPFATLENWYFAADIYLHLVAIGPWEVSPQDALVAGLGTVVTERVGSSECQLTGELARFRVPFGDHDAAAGRMIDLARASDRSSIFAPAREMAWNYTAQAIAKDLIIAVENLGSAR